MVVVFREHIDCAAYLYILWKMEAVRLSALLGREVVEEAERECRLGWR